MPVWAIVLICVLSPLGALYLWGKAGKSWLGYYFRSSIRLHETAERWLLIFCGPVGWYYLAVYLQSKKTTKKKKDDESEQETHEAYILE